MKLADIITLSRIFISPVLFFIYFLPAFVPAWAGYSIMVIWPVLIMAELTDFFDGYFARRQHQVSDFGKLFDPFADVVLHLTMFICYLLSGYMPAFIFLLIVYREFGMLFVRLIAAKQGVAIGARKGGKLKTVLYVICGFYSLMIETIVRLNFEVALERLRFLSAIGLGLYIVACFAAYASFFDYLIQFKSVLFEKKPD